MGGGLCQGFDRLAHPRADPSLQAIPFCTARSDWHDSGVAIDSSAGPFLPDDTSCRDVNEVFNWQLGLTPQGTVVLSACPSLKHQCGSA